MADLSSQFAQLAQQVSNAPKGGAVGKSGVNPATDFGGLPVNIAGLDTGLKFPIGLGNAVAGAGRGMENIVRHVGNLTGLESNTDLANANKVDAPLLATGAGKVGNFIGETAATAPLMLGAGELAGAGALGSGLARIAGSTLGRGAIEGATQGFLSADPGQRTQGTLLGGVLGTALPFAGALGGRLMRGLSRTPEAQALLDRGIDLTPGQLNPEAQRNASEEAYQSLPLVGAAIRRARMGAQKQYAQSVFKEGSAPGHIPTPGDANEMLAAAYKSFEPLYDQAKGFPTQPAIVNAGANTPLKDALKAAVASKTSLATAPERKPVAAFLSNELSRLNGTSDSLLAARSNIRAKIRSLALKGDDKDVVPLLEQGEQAFTNALRSQLPKDALSALDTADSKYGNYKILERAVAGSKDQVSGLTPSKLSDAVAKATPQGVYARGGGGPLRDLAKEGKAVFEARSPATGHRIGVLGGEAELAAKHPMLAWPAAALRVGSIISPLGRHLAAGTTPLQGAARALQTQALAATNPLLRSIIDRYARSGLTQALLPQAPGALDNGASTALALGQQARGLL